MTDAQALRHQLRAAGYCPVPLYGKEPPRYGKNNKRKGLKDWEQLWRDLTPEQIDWWTEIWPDAINTGVLCHFTPTLDLDILNEEAVRALEDHVREHYEDSGYVLPRIGLPPKRAIPFRTEEPFKKFTVNLIAPNATADAKPEKIEFLADGALVVVAGIHPDTKQPYHWPRGEPGKIKLEDLPYIREAEARALVEDLVEILVRDFGYKRAPSRPQQRQADSAPKLDGGQSKGESDWTYLYDNIRKGRELHDSLRTLAAKMIACGTNSGAAINQLRALMESSAAPKDERWRARVSEIPAAVDSAVAKYGKQPEPAEPVVEPKPSTSGYTIDDAIKVFEKWLILKDPTPFYAVVGTVAANLLPGIPVWLGLVAPPSSAKTELLDSIMGLPYVRSSGTVTTAALLSGIPKKQQATNVKGGLLKEIGSFGILLLKDFGSILSMRPDAKTEVFAALREIFDGAWTRHLGTEGGKTYTWKGKLGLIFGVTGAIDVHYSADDVLGNRYLLCRLQPSKGQFRYALKHAGPVAETMRKQLASAIVQLFAAPRREPRALTEDEIDQLDDIISLAVCLRGAVTRDRIKRELEYIHGAEGTARMGQCLERLLAGLDSLGVDRTIAFDVAKSIALDSVPPLRRRAYELLVEHKTKSDSELKTAEVAETLDLPTNTVRRALEDLAAYRLARRIKGGSGKADGWVARIPE
jgi:hypothetical protein